MPSPPPTPIQTANAAAMITIPLPKEIIRDSFGRSMAVKYPAPVILNPTTRNDRLNILNTAAEYCLSPSSFSEIKNIHQPVSTCHGREKGYSRHAHGRCQRVLQKPAAYIPLLSAVMKAD